MVSILKPAGRILPDRLQMEVRIRGIADVRIGGRHGKGLQPREGGAIGDGLAGLVDEAKALAASLASQHQLGRRSTLEAVFAHE